MIEIREEPSSALEHYARIPIAIEVREVLDVVAVAQGLGGLQLCPRAIERPYAKDYDAEPDNHPTDWPRRFDLTRWGFLGAYLQGERAGGAAIALESAGVETAPGRYDQAILWDIRVAPSVRGRGVGRALFDAAQSWAAARGARRLRAETQNVNVGACRFYARQGCTLVAIDRTGYPSLPDETLLLWEKDLQGNARPERR